MGKLKNKVPKWVWQHLEQLELDEPMPTVWFVDSLNSRLEELKALKTRVFSNKYWDCSPQGVHPILRQAGYKNVGFHRQSNNTLWHKQRS
jgi:hypothetical protein